VVDPVQPHDPRGILYPTRLPTFHRVPAPPGLGDLVRWFWIPEWRLAPGRTSRQSVLPFPASNLVVEPDGVTLAGPTTRVSHRDLTGAGWAVGALLRPAAVASLCPDGPRAVRDAEVAVAAPELRAAVAAAMAGGRSDEDEDEDEDAGAGAARRRAAVAAFAGWLADHVEPPDARALLANRLEDLVAADRSVTQVEQAAAGLGVSVRAVQRLAERYVGLPPLAVIRRYRLQEAAQRLRDEPGVTIADVAAELGYADQAHLSHDFRSVLGLPPSAYRGDAGRTD